MSSSETPFSVSPLTPTVQLPHRSPNPKLASILALTQRLHITLNNIANAPGELRALADDLAQAATELYQTCLLPIPPDEYERALQAVRGDLDELERNIVQYSSLLRRGWTTTIPNLNFARNCVRLREQLSTDVQAVQTLHRRASTTSTVFEEEIRAAFEEEEERDVLTSLPPPVFVSKASRKWRRAVGVEDDQQHLWSPVSAENMESAWEGYDRERREAMVRQIRTEDNEQEETDLISIMATPTVLSFSAGNASARWTPQTMSVHHIEKSSFSPPPLSPVPLGRDLPFVDTKGGVLVQILPFLGVVVASVMALALVRSASSLVLGFS